MISENQQKSLEKLTSKKNFKNTSNQVKFSDEEDLKTKNNKYNSNKMKNKDSQDRGSLSSSDSDATTKKISDFFRESRIKPNSIKIPTCNISRGLLLAIVFFILFSFMIVWFLISNDFDLEDSHGDAKFNGITNLTFALFNKTSLDQHNYDRDFFSTKLFVLIATVLIVLTIISLVFIFAIIHYYKKPNLYSDSARSQGIVSSIFSNRGHNMNLFYLDQAESRSLKDEEHSNKSDVKKNKSKKEESRPKSNKSKDKIEKSSNHPPIIIVEESN